MKIRLGTVTESQSDGSYRTTIVATPELNN